ncbi:MAG: 1-(5-phosphoribosyl)-5-amino-4-imidazole-carboxylate carboxylase [Armatimonadetes bacterium]|jgi:NCAIR mutase (PurE)-related protein|nr:1-(5-phosphoribosyl)-5-amino-4-imidazole-carboxylate carboxylase [Armatimonadota bacterium]
MDQIRDILSGVQTGLLTIDEAVSALKWSPFEDLGFARLDTHRQLRTGVPEVVYCAGKTPPQVAAIVERLYERNGLVMGTRVSPEHFAAVAELLPHAVLHEPAGIFEVRTEPRPEAAENAPYLLVVSAGTSDQKVAEEAAVTAEILGTRVERLYDCGVAGLHRILGERERLGRAKVIVVVAGMEGALPSVIGGLVEQPVVAVPTSVGYGASFNGLAALLGMLNTCASGVTVVNIDNGFGAGYFAHLICRG